LSGYRIPGPLGLRPEQDSIDDGTSCLARTPPPGPIGLNSGTGSSPFSQFDRIDAVRRAIDRSHSIYIVRLTAIFAGIDITPILAGLWETAKQAGFVVGGFTALGAVGGALLSGGVGTIPGAMAGAGVGVVVLNLMGLEELISEIPEQIASIVDPYRAGVSEAWRAPDSPERESSAIESAASRFAEGHVALSLAALGAVIAYASRGKGRPLKEILEKSKLKNAAEWLESNAPRLKERLDARARGEGGHPSSGSSQAQPALSRPRPEAERIREPSAQPKKAPPRNRLQQVEIPCFNPYDRPTFQSMSPARQRKFLENYAKQLRRQQEAINSMTADEFQAARQLFNSAGRGGAQALQNDARQRFEERLENRIRDSLLSKVPPGAPVDPETLLEAAETRAAEIMKDLDVLHVPDMVAGGSSKTAIQMGDRGVNRAIGGSWGARIQDIDLAASRAVITRDRHALMNVKLEVCRGRLP
jgi:hypothetical protein